MKDAKVSKKVKSSAKPLAHTVGRRKASVARVWLRKGSGNVVVNGKDYLNYFDTETTRLEAAAALKVCQQEKTYDIDANIVGGGIRGQANALKLGIARALVVVDERTKPVLRQSGFLTVDSRVKERKKPGQPGARRKFQFVKR